MVGIDGEDSAVSRPNDGRDANHSLAASVAAAADALDTVRDAELRCSPDVAVPDRLCSVLVGVAGGVHSGATVDLANRLAADQDAWLDLFHVAADDAGPGERYLRAAAARLGESDCVDSWLVEGGIPAHEIAEQSTYYDAVVVGAPAGGRLDRLVYGSTTGLVSEEASSPVIVVSADGDSSLLGPAGADLDPDHDSGLDLDLDSDAGSDPPPSADE